MKRRLLSLVFVLVMAFALILPVSADVIWTPDNDFYESHWEECTYVGREYEFAGYDGTVAVWDAPGGAVVETLPNGQQGAIQFVWSDGDIDWGCLYNYSDDWSKTGWVPMDDLALIYDSQQFMEDHQTEIDTVDGLAVDFDAAIVYSYPGGPSREWILKENLDYMSFSDAFSATSIYTDDSGLRWGYVGYYMGRVQGWVCLDDPMNEHLDTNIVPTPFSAAQLRGSATVTPGVSQQFPLILAGVLVAVVVGVTAVLICKLRPRKKD